MYNKPLLPIAKVLRHWTMYCWDLFNKGLQTNTDFHGSLSFLFSKFDVTVSSFNLAGSGHGLLQFPTSITRCVRYSMPHVFKMFRHSDSPCNCKQEGKSHAPLKHVELVSHGWAQFKTAQVYLYFRVLFKVSEDTFTLWQCCSQSMMGWKHGVLRKINYFYWKSNQYIFICFTA